LDPNKRRLQLINYWAANNRDISYHFINESQNCPATRRDLDRKPAFRAGKLFRKRCPKVMNPEGSNFIQGRLNPTRALGMIRQMMEFLLRRLAASGVREDFDRGMSVQLRDAKPRQTRITRDDITGALASFLLRVLSCLPAVLPFLIMRDPLSVLRASNGMLLAMVFGVEWYWARYTNTNRLIAGLALLQLGLGLVGRAILL
jgi:hypothetical protein